MIHELVVVGMTAMVGEVMIMIESKEDEARVEFLIFCLQTDGTLDLHS